MAVLVVGQKADLEKKVFLSVSQAEVVVRNLQVALEEMQVSMTNPARKVRLARAVTVVIIMVVVAAAATSVVVAVEVIWFRAAAVVVVRRIQSLAQPALRIRRVYKVATDR
jgi:hypothetical protein